MTDDEIGLSFYIEGFHPDGIRPDGTAQAESRASVFGDVDQDAMIAKLDAVTDDDLGSTFFGDSILEVENAAIRAFDIGIRVHASDPAAPPNARVDVLTTAGIDASPAVAANPVEVPGIPVDSRTAFILRGPARIKD